MTKLNISPALALPLDTFVTSTQMIVAKKRRGKSYLAQREAEELLEHKQQVVALDPTGAWWGLRSSADGKEPGYPIVVFGGDHGDVMLDPLSGETLARAIVEECFSAVVDLTSMRKGERIRFGAEFLETLYRLNRAAMHLFIDEADVFAPQVTRDPQQARLLGATDELVRRGGLRGVGVTLITQRSQVVSKDVISQIDAMAVLQMNHPKDIAAVRDWMEANYEDEDAIDEALRSLSRLPVGTAWYLSPERELFDKIEISRKRTFDSGRTPKPGERVVQPKRLAPVDLDRLGASMKAAVEQTKANDPKALKARVAELEKQLAVKAPAAKVETKVVEKPVIKEQQLQRIGVLIEQGDGVIKRWDDVSANAHEALAGVEKRMHAYFEKLSLEIAGLRTAVRAPHPTNREVAAAQFANDGKVTKLVGKHQIRAYPVTGVHRGDEPRHTDRVKRDKPSRGGELACTGALRRIMVALAQHPDGLPDRKIGAFSGVSTKGGSYRTYLSRARGADWIEDDGQVRRITDEGLTALGDFEPLPTGPKLVKFWVSELGGAAARILEVIVDAYPDALDHGAVGERSGVSIQGGSYRTYLSRLRSRDLIEDVHRGAVKASETLFEVAR